MTEILSRKSVSETVQRRRICPLGISPDTWARLENVNKTTKPLLLDASSPLWIYSSSDIQYGLGHHARPRRTKCEPANSSRIKIDPVNFDVHGIPVSRIKPITAVTGLPFHRDCPGAPRGSLRCLDRWRQILRGLCGAILVLISALFSRADRAPATGSRAAGGHVVTLVTSNLLAASRSRR